MLLKAALARKALGGRAAELAMHTRSGWISATFRLGAPIVATLLLAAGCGRREERRTEAPPPEMTVAPGAKLRLEPGQAFHFSDHPQGGKAPPGLARSSDGALRIALKDARQPVLCAPAPHATRQFLALPCGAELRLAFGMAQASWDKKGAGVRFIATARQGAKTMTLLSQQLSRWQGEESPNWRRLRLPIPFAGEVEIELRTEIVGSVRPGRPEDCVGAYALWVDPTVIAPAPQPRPNIVMVVVDSLSASHLGCYGYERATSPFLDSLAARGVLFEDANCQATWTMPSVQSLLTSSYRLTRGSLVAKLGSLPAAAESLASLPVSMPVSLQGELRTAGYETIGCTGGGFLDPALGFDAGFDWYWSPDHAPMLPNQLAVLKDRLSQEMEPPFFVLLHTYEVHNYFLGWGQSVERFDRGYLGRLTDPRLLADAVLHGDPKDMSPADLQYIKDLYDGEVVRTDRYLRLFFDWLLGQPWADNTVIVVTADHGEALGDHGVISHGGMPYREIAWVPLIIHFADGRWRGRRIEQPVALSDIMPTLLDLAGVPQPASVVGRSLIPLMRGERLADRALFCESRGAALMAREGHWWYYSSRGQPGEELYNTASDPGQQRNLAGSASSELARMRRVLAELTMQAARGYRLVVGGRRQEPLTIQLESSANFVYLDVPTIQQQGALKIGRPMRQDSRKKREHHAIAHQATIQLPPGEELQVILFEPSDPKGTIFVSARSSDRRVEPGRFHLGRSGASPTEARVAIGAAARALLSAEQPPGPVDPKTWGLWLWLPSSAAESIGAPALETRELPDDLKDQLRSLGYLR